MILLYGPIDVRIVTVRANEMSAIFFPILWGMLAFVGAVIALWFPGSLLLVPLFGVGLLPAVVLIPALFVSGFVTGKKSKTTQRSLKVGMGAVAGATSILLILFVARSSGLIWLYPLMVAGGGAVGSLGGFISTRV